MQPANTPIANAAARLTNNPELAPIITPPAKVAFRISSIWNLSLIRAEIAKVDTQLPVIANIVFDITVVF